MLFNPFYTCFLLILLFSFVSPLVSALLTLWNNFWVNYYPKFTDLVSNPWAIQEKSHPNSKRWGIFLAGGQIDLDTHRETFAKILIAINIGIHSWYDHISSKSGICCLCNEVHIFSQAERKTWLWKHNSSKQNRKSLNILYFITKTYFKRNQELSGQID